MGPLKPSTIWKGQRDREGTPVGGCPSGLPCPAPGHGGTHETNVPDVPRVPLFSRSSPARLSRDATSPVADDARDVAVCLSIALQHQVPAEAIHAAVTREAAGRSSGIAGAVVDLLAEGRQ